MKGDELATVIQVISFFVKKLILFQFCMAKDVDTLNTVLAKPNIDLMSNVGSSSVMMTQLINKMHTQIPKLSPVLSKQLIKESMFCQTLDLPNRKFLQKAKHRHNFRSFRR